MIGNGVSVSGRADASRLYPATVAAFVAVLIVSNIVSTKIVAVGPFTFDGGTILFPVVYIFGDILTEVYGLRKAKQAIWTGFFSLLFMSFVLWFVGVLPAAADWNGQDAYTTILMAAPRIALASVIAYWCGSMSNSFIMARMKAWTAGRFLWARTIGSTIVGEAVDTLLFCMIAFYGVLPDNLFLTVIVSNYVFKVAYEALATPLTYAAVSFYKRKEGDEAPWPA